LIPRIVYVNGRFVPYRAASVHVEDRGYQFADGVYEVCAIRHGALIDLEPHIARLKRSMGELRIPAPMSDRALGLVFHEVIRRNTVATGLLYVQVTRGVAGRDHPFPTTIIKPSLVVMARPIDFQQQEARAAAGVSVITVPDIRWRRCDIKSIGLLGNVLAKQAAREAGAAEAWMIDDAGLITEGASTNAWIVDEHGVLRTRALSDRILPGVTRGELLPIAARLGVKVETSAFTPSEAYASREAFMTSASSAVVPVIAIDGRKIGNGRPGPVAAELRKTYWDRSTQS
jgi:D-alanine transaminase